MHRRFRLPALLLIALAPMPTMAAPSFFIDLFARTCMKHYAKPEGLKADIEALHASEVPAKAAGFFLGGTPGTAWAVAGPEGVRYVISLRDDGICATFAQKADTVIIEQEFNAMVSSSPAPLVASKLTDENQMMPTGPIHTISYGWSAGQADTTQITFTLTTAVSPDAPVQAMASLTRTRKGT